LLVEEREDDLLLEKSVDILGRLHFDGANEKKRNGESWESE